MTKPEPYAYPPEAKARPYRLARLIRDLRQVRLSSRDPNAGFDDAECERLANALLDFDPYAYRYKGFVSSRLATRHSYTIHDEYGYPDHTKHTWPERIQPHNV